MKNTIKSFLICAVTLLGSPAVFAQTAAKFEITCGDQMTYNSKGFEVIAGQNISLTLRNVGKIPLKTMGHNLVVLKPGTSLPRFSGKAALDKKGYLPEDAESKKLIVAATKRLGGGESDTIEFTLTEPGQYPFLCTTPGHFSVMNGVITVKAKAD